MPFDIAKKTLIVFLFFLFINQAQAGNKFALVIGNSNYQESPLKNPVNDAQDMAEALRNVGFDVNLKIDASQEDMEQAVREFGQKINADSVNLFYYSGHGVQHDGSNYLIPIGAMSRVSAPEHLRYKTVDAGYVLGTMQQAQGRLNIVILDACRNNPFKSFTRGVDRGLKRMQGAEGTIIAYSTSPGKVARDGIGRNSPYTINLIREMKRPNLPVEIMFKYVRRGVKKLTLGRQSPWYESSISGEFSFVGGTKTAQKPERKVERTEERETASLLHIPKPRTAPSAPSAPSNEKTRGLEDKQGKWVNRFRISEKNTNAPEVFWHYFIHMDGDLSASPGTIYKGAKWDKSNCPFWNIVYGKSDISSPTHHKVACFKDLTYLGPSWEPRFKDLYTQVKKSKPVRNGWENWKFVDYSEQARRAEYDRSAPPQASKSTPSPTPTPSTTAPSSTSDLMERKGKWMKRFNVNVKSAKAPDVFGHYFVHMSGNLSASPGTILKGVEWDKTDCPFWNIVYGKTDIPSPTHLKVVCFNDLTYLGPKWDPKFKKVYTQVKKATPSRKDWNKWKFVDYTNSGNTETAGRAKPAGNLVERQGKWVKRFNVNVKSKTAPDVFGHYFIHMDGDLSASPGTIYKGAEWDKTNCPFWNIVYGKSDKPSRTHLKVACFNDLTYLGPKWDPKFKKLYTQVKKSKPVRNGWDKWKFVDFTGSSASGTLAQRQGQWVTRFKVNVKSTKAPDVFGHYFIHMDGDLSASPGTIYKGAEWDKSNCPFWNIVYGKSDISSPTHLKVACFNDLTYLGPKWDPKFKKLYTQVKKSKPVRNGWDKWKFVDYTK